MACRAVLKVTMLIGILLLYLVLWYLNEQYIYWLTAASCTATVLCSPFLTPACVAGVAFSLFKGISLGSGPLRLDMHWDI
jgi:hypothetical protein